MTHGYIKSLEDKLADIENKIELYEGYKAFLESEIATAKKMYKEQEE